MGTIEMKHPSPDYLATERRDPVEEFAATVREVREQRRNVRKRALMTTRLRKDAAGKGN